MNTQIFEQARKLAEDLLNTPEGKKYQEAKFIFEGDDESINTLKEYGTMRQEFQAKMQKGESGEQFETARQELNDMVAEIKNNEIITNLFQAEENFNRMVTNIMDIFNATLTGESQEETSGGCCGSGGCGGCGSGCH